MPAQAPTKDEIPTLVLIGEGISFKEELCCMIERTQMFSDFTRQEVALISNYARAYQVEKGDTIFKEGEKGTYMCLVISGKIDIFKESDDRKMKKVTTIRAGKTMGEMSVLDELPHSATTIAIETTILVLITKFNFDRLTEEQPVIGIKIMKCIAKLISLRLRQTTGILLDYLE